MIIIMTEKTFLFFEMVVRIRCPVKLELTVSPAKRQHAPSSIKLIEQAGAGYYLRRLLAVSSRHQHLTVVWSRLNIEIQVTAIYNVSHGTSFLSQNCIWTTNALWMSSEHFIEIWDTIIPKLEPFLLYMLVSPLVYFFICGSYDE